MARFSLAQVEAASQSARFAMLGERGWFRASEVAQRAGVKRGGIREHARILIRQGLLERRAVPGASRPTFQYRVTDDGAELRRRIAALVGRPYRKERRRPEPASLLALTDPRSASAESLSDALLAASRMNVRPIAAYWIDQ